MPVASCQLRAKKPHRAEANTYGLPRGEAIRKELVSVFREQRRKLLAFLATGRKDSEGDNLPHAWPDWNDFKLGALAMSERMTPLLEAVWDQAAGKFAPRVGLDPNTWQVVNPHTERMIAAAALAFSQSTNDTTSMQLDVALEKTRQALKEGVVEQGESVFYLTKRVKEIFDGAETWRARRIAQTETSRAVHAAQEQAAIASGVVTGWTWLLSSDACPLCQTIARRAPAVQLGQPFAQVGSNPHYSEVRFPPAHPHCNCTVNEVLDSDEQPSWAEPLHQPKPEAEDYPESTAATPKPAAERSDRILKPPTHPDGTPKFPAAKVRFAPTTQEERKNLGEATETIFGKRKTQKQLAAMVGAPDGAEVSLRAGAGSSIISFKVKHPNLEIFYGTIEKIEGQSVIDVGRLNVIEPLRGKGIGTGIHGRMVDWASRLGVDRLELWGSAAEGDNGNITWPLLGYDGPLNAVHRQQLPEALRHAATIQELLAMPGGTEAWYGAREGISLAFNLSPGSEQRRSWVHYWGSKTSERRTEVMERVTGKKGLDPNKDYPNGLGLSNEEIIEGYEALARYYEDPANREAIRGQNIVILSPRLHRLSDAQIRGIDPETLRD